VIVIVLEDGEPQEARSIAQAMAEELGIDLSSPSD
jgi:hypothetical protein